MVIVSDEARARRNAGRRAWRAAKLADPAWREKEQKRRRKRSRERKRRYRDDPTFAASEDKRRAKARSKARRTYRDTLPFVGCDGEGVGRGAESRYALFRMGDRELGPLPKDRMLETPDLLRFISEAPADVIHVGFALGYDFSNILRQVPHDRQGNQLSRLDRIMQRDKAMISGKRNGFAGVSQWTWLNFAGHPIYGVDWLPRNHLSVCIGKRQPNGSVKQVPGSIRTIYDVFGNFQSSFVMALDRWGFGTGARADMIARMKKERSGFTTITAQIRHYCREECEALAELMTLLRDVALDQGLRPRTYNGPGKFAVAAHRLMGTPTTKELLGWTGEDGRKHPGLLSRPVIEASYAAYYGGRFELGAVGLLGKVYEYDISSAYPAKLLELPCLRHGKWHAASGDALARLDDSAIYVADVAFSHPASQRFGGLPLRKDGRLVWQRNGNGVYWSCEIRSAQRLGATVTHRDGYRFEKKCDCQPFKKVSEWFTLRQSLGKNTVGLFIKLVLNSLYGKLAQRVGAPPFANPVWAGLITALTRSQINDAIGLDPDAIVMIATDAIFSLRPLKLPVAEKGKEILGGWTADLHNGLTIVQPGLYWGRDAARHKLKTRGASASVLAPYTGEFEGRWLDYMALTPYQRATPQLKPPAVTIPYTMFIGLRLAYHRGKPETACQWVEDSKRISFDWKKKRAPDYQVMRGKKAIRLDMLTGSISDRSKIYDPPTDEGDGEEGHPAISFAMELEAMPDNGIEFFSPPARQELPN